MISEAEKIANKARRALSHYCTEECSAYCCRKGYLLINESEMELLVGENKDILMTEGSLRKMVDGMYSLNFSNSLGGCPQLKNSKCLIHNNPKRPRACIEFPIFITGKTVRVSGRCFGVRAGLIDPYITQLKKMGYDIM